MDDTLVEGLHGHGALPNPLDLRDQKYDKLAMAAIPFDWATGYDAEKTPTTTKNQGGSGSCGGQSGSYLDAMIQPEVCTERSARYIYSQIYHSGGGTTLREILEHLVKKGVAAESVVPSYQNGNTPAEWFMEDRSDNHLGDVTAAAYEGSGYAFIKPDIEAYAEAIRDNGGAIMQINGQNNGTWLSPMPVGPINNRNMWSHFVVCTGAMIRNGKKCIKIHNSWGPLTGENGYQWISEDYFATGYVLQGGVVYRKDSPIIEEKKITIMTQIIALLQQLINMKRTIGSYFRV